MLAMMHLYFIINLTIAYYPLLITQPMPLYFIDPAKKLNSHNWTEHFKKNSGELSKKLNDVSHGKEYLDDTGQRQKFKPRELEQFIKKEAYGKSLSLKKFEEDILKKKMKVGYFDRKKIMEAFKHKGVPESIKVKAYGDVALGILKIRSSKKTSISNLGSEVLSSIRQQPHESNFAKKVDSEAPKGFSTAKRSLDSGFAGSPKKAGGPVLPPKLPI